MTNSELEAKVEERQGAVAIRNELDKQIEACTEEIKAGLMERQVRRLVLGPWVPQLVLQERKSLDAKKLLSAGVTMDQIEKATTITPVESLRVMPRGEKDQ